jgi:hypothetical protein
LVQLAVFLGLALAGCRPAQVASPNEAWDYTDLRALAEIGPNRASLDLIALYTRLAGSDRQVRLDLLDLSFDPDSDFYLALDWRPGGTRSLPLDAEAGLDWDLLLVLPVRGQPYALAPAGPGEETFSPFPALIPRIARIPWQDMVVVSFNPNALPGIERGFSVQVFSASANQTTPADSLGPVRSEARPPRRAPVMLAFWNTFPAYTPAQVLRRWDGAHTGPFGGRHGLHVLVEAARQARVPVMLLDLKTPEALSALDYLGGLSEIRELAGKGFLILPDAAPGSPSLLPSPQAFPGWAVARAARESRALGAEFGLAGSPVLYAPSLGLLEAVAPADGLPAYAWIAAPLPDPAAGDQPLRWKTSRLLPLPPAEQEPALHAMSATPDGLSIELRRALLANALTEAQGGPPLLVLGGDLVDSAWGDPESARASLLYIAAHPWIQPYGLADLLRLQPADRLDRPAAQSGAGPFSQASAGAGSVKGSSENVPLFDAADSPESVMVPGAWVESLAEAQSSHDYEPVLAQAAWQAYRALFAPLPPEHPLLPALRARYAAFPGILLETARWAVQPGPIAACTLALDSEGHTGCLLASERVFSAYDPLGGRLLALFAFSPAGDLHQLVAPTSQFTIGFGDPSTWDLAAGPGAEPAGIHGAFAGSPSPWEHFTSEINPGELAFTAADGRWVKTFALLERGLRVDYPSSAAPLMVQVPLALDPWKRFEPNWGDRYRESGSQQVWAWGMAGGPEVVVRTSASLSADLFSDSRRQLSHVEDPNFPYPPGHYQPFAMAVVEVKANEAFFVEITLKSGD